MRRWVFRAAVLGLLLPLGYLGLGLAGGVWITGAPRQIAPVLAQIGLVGGPIHYDLLIPLNDSTRARFGFVQTAGVPVANPAAEWVLVGWGAREFYTSAAQLSDMQLGTIWQAATGDSAVMRVDVLGQISGFDGIPMISLTGAEMAALLNAVLANFSTQTALDLPGFTATDAFFPARGRFNLFNTCNVWVGQTLRAAGLPFGRWTPFPQSIRLALDRANLADKGALTAIDR